MGKKGRKEPSKQSLRNALREKNLMKLNHVLANGWVTLSLIVIMDVVIFLLLNYSLHTFAQLPQVIKKSATGVVPKINYSLSSNLEFSAEHFSKFSAIYIIAIICLIALDIKIAYQIQISYRDFDKGQKNSMRWTTLKEIQQQYKAIPDIGQTVTDYYEGNGGVPVSHYDGKYYIDNSGVHTLVLGITRSGKGEMFVTTMVDIYSRAAQQASMIINDPKLELCAMSYDTLVQRGYEVHVLNLIEPINSMGYNPLSLITESYKKGDIEGAEMLASTFCYSIFNSEDSTNGDNQYFADNATFCLSAFIFAMIEDCLAFDAKENEKRKVVWEQERQAFDSLPEAEKEQMGQMLDALYDAKNCRERSEDITERSSLAKKIKELEIKTRGYENHEFVPTRENEKKITMTSIINTMGELSRMKMDDEGDVTMVDYYFNTRPTMNRAKLLFSCIEIAGGQRTKGSIYSTMLSKLILFTYSSIAKLTAETTVNMEDIGFGEKPVAIFMGTPDYDHSKDFIATIFIRQTSYVLSKRATLTPNGKCKREVIYHLDEFGSLPKIEGFDSAVTVALGRGIRYNLIIQSYAQIESKYGDASNTIIGNCGNKIYIQSGDDESAERFSKAIGTEMITVINRTGSKMSLNKSITEMLDEAPLISANELTNMLEGENVIIRVSKRTDLQGRDIRPYAIYNKKETETDMPYRYTFLEKYFPSGKLISDVTKETRAHIDGNNVFDVAAKIEEIIENAKEGESVANNKIANENLYKKIKDMSLDELDKQTIGYVSDFYEKNQSVIDVEWKYLVECTIDEIRLYLLKKSPLLAKAWEQLLIQHVPPTATEQPPSATGSTSLSENPELKLDETDEGVQAILKAQKKERQAESSEPVLENSEPEEVTTYTLETKISSFPNSMEIVNFLFSNGDTEMLEEEEIEEELDVLDLTVEEITNFIRPEKQHYFETLLGRGLTKR